MVGLLLVFLFVPVLAVNRTTGKAAKSYTPVPADPEYQGETILLATDGGIVGLPQDGGKRSTLVNLTDGVSVIDFPSAWEFYFISENKIWQASYNPDTRKSSSPRRVLTGTSTLTDLTVDWVNSKLYWSCNSNDTGEVYVSDLLGSNLRREVRVTKNISSVLVDPYKGLLFYVKEDQFLVGHSLFQPNSGKTDTTEKIYFESTRIIKVALEAAHRTIYAVVTFEETNIIYKIDYKGTPRKTMVYSGYFINNLKCIHVADRTLVWASLDELTYSVCKGRINEFDQLDEVTVVDETKQEVRDIKIHNPSSKRLTTSALCAKMDCPYVCTKKGSNGAECSCPQDMMLSTNGTVCTMKETYDQSAPARLMDNGTSSTPPQEPSCHVNSTVLLVFSLLGNAAMVLWLVLLHFCLKLKLTEICDCLDI